MTVTSDQLVQTFMERAKARRRRLAAERERPSGLLPEVAQELRQSYGATRVVLFGSLLHDGFHERSDVDIAVDGVGRRLLGVAEADASRRLGRAVELFDWNDLSDSFRARIAAEGRELW